MLPKIKVEIPKGFLGAAKTTDKAPYIKVDKKPEMYSCYKDSFFITLNKKTKGNKK